MLGKAVVFGMNVLTLVGFLVMGIGLTLSRQKRIRSPLAFALLGVGTALIFLGFYVTPQPAP